MKLNLVYYSTLLFWLISTIGYAKKAPKSCYVDSFKSHYVNTKVAEVNLDNYDIAISPNSKQSAVNTFLQKMKPGLFEGNKSLKAISLRQTPKASYYQYQQYYNNVPVYKSGITVASDNKDKIYCSVFNTYAYSEKDLQSNQPLVVDSKIIAEYFESDEDSIVIKKIETAVFINNANARPQYVYVVDFKNFTKNWYHQIILNSNLDLLYAKDLRSYFKGNETTITAKVFNPDPLTTARKLYGGYYIDSMDINLISLNNERVDVEIPVCKEGDMFVLNSEFISVQEVENPVTNATKFDSNKLDLGRMANAFENINAVYHVNEYNNYLIAIGYEDLVKPIAIDAHAAFGEDQSYFEPDVPALLFGEGGVDDAEDADVVVHEYGHAISHNAAPNTNNGNQRQAIDEGFGDYIAASYSREIKEFGWERVFSWDGHNEFWEGRFADTDKTYPNDLLSTIHQDGEIWCRSLFDIEEAIGRDKTHEILLESMHSYQRNINMVDAANFFVQADSILFEGKNYFEIWKAFYDRGFLEYQVFAGKDTIICKGDEVRIGTENVLPPNSNISWSPNENINNPNSIEPFVSPTTSTLYVLSITVEDITYTDEVFVELDTCNSTEINLLNVNGYLAGEFVVLSLPNNVNKQKLIMNLYNNQGQAFSFNPTQISSNNYKAHIGQLARGVYFLRIIDKNLNQYTFRFLKV